MATNDPSYPSSEREARRALLADSLAGLNGAADPDLAASDVVRALDHYIEGGGSPQLASPEARARLRESLGAAARGAPGGPESVTDAIDDYLQSASAAQIPRETSVTNFGHLGGNEIKWARWIVMILAVMATTVVAVTLSGGLLAGGIILAIWITVLIAVGMQ